MECVLGMACNDFSIIAADMSTMHSIILMKCDEKKIYPVSNNVIMGIVGGQGDTTQFAEYIVKNIQLYKMRNGYNLSPEATAHFTRHNLATSLRSQTPYQVNMLLGGYDKETGGQLFFLDYLASYQKVPYASHGYGGIFTYSVFDRYYRPDLTVDEAYKILETCIKEIQKRLIINLPNFSVVVVDKDGIKEKPNITQANLASGERSL